MPAKLFTAPTVEPVSLTDAKEQCHLDSSAHDGHLSLCITAAREWCEAYQNRAYITQTWKLIADHFPRRRGCSDLWLFDGREYRNSRIELPRAPLQSVSSITYVDQDGNAQTWDPSEYTVDAQSEPGRIVPAFGECYPTTRCQANAVTITYVAGYGASASNVPAKVKLAMRLLIGHWYENREAILTGTISKEIELGVERLLIQDRVYG